MYLYIQNQLASSRSRGTDKSESCSPLNLQRHEADLKTTTATKIVHPDADPASQGSGL